MDDLSRNQESPSKRSSQHRKSAPAASRRLSSRSQKSRKSGKKRHVGRAAGRRRKQSARPEEQESMETRAPEAPLMPQPTLDSPEDEPTERHEEPPPPSACAPNATIPLGDDDNLFEYVF